MLREPGNAWKELGGFVIQNFGGFFGEKYFPKVLIHCL
jgi:hypothetical protein